MQVNYPPSWTVWARRNSEDQDWDQVDMGVMEQDWQREYASVNQALGWQKYRREPDLEADDPRVW